MLKMLLRCLKSLKIAINSPFRRGIMDPDSKSAASWGDASKGQQRKPVEEA